MQFTFTFWAEMCCTHIQIALNYLGGRHEQTLQLWTLSWSRPRADLHITEHTPVNTPNIRQIPEHAEENWRKQSQTLTHNFFIIVIWVSKALIIFISKFINCQLLWLVGSKRWIKNNTAAELLLRNLASRAMTLNCLLCWKNAEPWHSKSHWSMM